MGCSASSNSSDDNKTTSSKRQDAPSKQNNYDNQTSKQNSETIKKERTPPPHEPSPPPRKPTPPRDPTPPPREPTPPPREPTPPAREPTPPPREPTPTREPTPPPREPTPPPPDSAPVETVSPKSQHEDAVEVKRQPKSSAEGEYYETDELGIHHMSADFRHNPEEPDKIYSHYPDSFDDHDHFLDTDFTLQKAIRGETADLEWKRPTEIRDCPCLFTEGTTRYDIGQGYAGTCWFLSMVACLADNKAYIDHIIPADGYHKDEGVFVCRFWRFGEWEDVIIDDCLPVIYGDQFWGARSKEDPNEVWVSLLEKAFARFHGSYNASSGGMPGDAYLTLTGGCAECINFEKNKPADKERFFWRIHNALNTGSFLCTSVSNENHNKYGLIGNHAYSLTGAKKVTTNSGREVYLIRIRNPWGATEWTGPWKDGGAEWDDLPEGSVEHANIDDGEFYIELDDFLTYFADCTICSLTPDFDKDGCVDPLKYKTNIFGDWWPGLDSDGENRTQNPRFMFHLSDEGKDEEGFIPVVMQIVQKTHHRDEELASIRVDLFKVLGEKEGAERCVYVAEMLGQGTNTWMTEKQTTMRYKVEPGNYIVIPSTMTGGVHKEFLIRIFTPGPLKGLKKTPEHCGIMETRHEDINRDDINDPSIDMHQGACQTIFGSWHQGGDGGNAGGQVSCDTYFTNPQIEVIVPDRGKQLITFELAQYTGSREHYPIGLRLFQLTQSLPVNQQYLYDNYDNSPRSIKGEQGCFMDYWSCSITYVLEPGRYLAILHANHPSQEAEFALVVKSSCYLELNPYQL